MKVKVLLSALPLPCVLCLGYTLGIGFLGLGWMGCVILGVISVVWCVLTSRILTGLLLIFAGTFGLWQGTSAHTTAELVLESGRAYSAEFDRSTPLRLVAMNGSERAGEKTLLTAKTLGDSPFMIRIEAREHFSMLPGDIFDAKGRFRPLEHREESSFNYPIYLAKGGVGAVFQLQTATKVRSGPPSFARTLAFIRRESLSRIAQLWPGDTGGLIAGILVGARGTFSEQLMESMRVTGLMHIVAVSGFNMTILINTVLAMTTFLALRWRATIAGLVLIIFTLFVGPSGAVVRACLMGIIALIAKVHARPATAFTCLMYAAFCMLIFSPLDLLYDIGFQLSFLAVLGLLWGEPFIKRRMTLLPKYLAEQLSPTLAAILWTLPISIIYFENISLIAPLANLIIPPSIPHLMLGGFLTFCFSWIPGLGFFVWVTQSIVLFWTELLLQLSHWLATVPYAALPLTIEKAWSMSMLTGCYLVLLFIGYHSAPNQEDVSSLLKETS